MPVELTFTEVLPEIIFDKNSSWQHAYHQKFTKSHLVRGKTKPKKDKNDDQRLRRSGYQRLPVDQTQSCIFCLNVSTCEILYVFTTINAE